MQETTVLTLSLFLLIASTAYFAGCSGKDEKTSVTVTTPSVTVATDVACPNCKGIGRYGTCTCFENRANANPACVICSGSGTILCGFCNGRGKVPQESVPHVVKEMGLMKERIEAEKAKREERELQVLEQQAQARIAAAQAEQARIAAEQRERERIAAEQRAIIAAEQMRQMEVQADNERRQAERKARQERAKIDAEERKRRVQEEDERRLKAREGLAAGE